MSKVRVSVISYLNTVPFLYGLCNHPVHDMIDIKLSTPAESANAILSGNTDVAILPSVIVPELGVDNIISDYCIGATGKVASVLFCSNVPVEQTKHVYLDAESRTSVILARILFRRFWKKDITYSSYEYGPAGPDPMFSYILIGDKALEHSDKFEFVYDLAEEWKSFTSFPFVFACWTAARKLEDSFLSDFNKALEYGVNNTAKAVDAFPGNFDKKFAINYLTHNISYPLSPDKREGLSEFWSLALEELKSKVRWRG